MLSISKGPVCRDQLSGFLAAAFHDGIVVTEEMVQRLRANEEGYKITKFNEGFEYLANNLGIVARNALEFSTFLPTFRPIALIYIIIVL